MDILPLRFVNDEDSFFIGNSLVNLARLKQLNFPVPEGFVVSPPTLVLQSLLKHFEHTDREVFDQSLEIIKKQYYQIPPSEEFVKELTAKKIDYQKVWKNLLDLWLSEIRSSFWRNGFTKNLNFLTAQPVFLTNKITAFGKAYFDYDLGRLRCEVEEGKLFLKELEELEETIKKANKKLGLPFVYHWIKDKQVKIVKILPFTQSDFKVDNIVQKSSDQTSTKKSRRNILKLFLCLENNLTLEKDIDGILLNHKSDLSAQARDLNLEKKDLRILQLMEACKYMSPEPVIYLLTDELRSGENIRGASHLLHSKSLLSQDAEIINFVKLKKNFHNIELGIPFVRSAFEYSELIKKLKEVNLDRKPTLRYWLELAVPENLLTIEDYLKVGVDGVILNLDSLASLLGGFSLDSEISNFYKQKVTGLLGFLDDKLTILHKQQIPVLAIGNLVLHDDVQAFLLKHQVWGICVEKENMIGRVEQIGFLEKHHFKHSAT